MKPLIRYFQQYPPKLFLVDGFGALIFMLLLAFILPALEHVFGIPAQVLYFLALWPLLFAIFDLLAHKSLLFNRATNFRIIASCKFWDNA